MKKSIELRAQLDEKRNALRDLLAAEKSDPDKIQEATQEVRNAESKYTAQLTLEESEQAAAQMLLIRNAQNWNRGDRLARLFVQCLNNDQQPAKRRNYSRN